MLAFSDIKFDDAQIAYVEKLPKGYRLATLDDFIVSHKCYEKKHRKLIGLQYLVKSDREDIYYVREVNEYLLDIDVEPLILREHVFVDQKDVACFKDKVLKEPKDFDVTDWYLR